MFNKSLLRLPNIILTIVVIWIPLIMIVRTTSAHPSGFYIFGCGDKDIEGEYRVTRETFNDIPVFLSPNGCRLFRQVTILWID